jgi:hypothetical protein
MSNTILNITYNLLQKDFEIDLHSLELSEQQLLKLLEKAIHYLLNQDFEKLLQICYRIDISEHLLKKILNESPPEEMGKELAQAILNRQMQKASIRIKYS